MWQGKNAANPESTAEVAKANHKAFLKTRYSESIPVRHSEEMSSWKHLRGISSRPMLILQWMMAKESTG